jgi:outer membrane protein assembly factor BamA
LSALPGNAQDSSSNNPAARKYGLFSHNPNDQTDITDVLRYMLKKGAPKKPYDPAHTPDKLHFSPLISPNYTPQTGFQILVGTLIAFYTDSGKNQNISGITTSIAYTQYHQTILPVIASIWSKDNKYNIQTDWRYLNYPSLTYGLGGGTTLDDGYYINYHYLRLHQSIYRTISKNIYLGIGYDYDHYWNIQELNAAGQDSTGGKTDFDKYGFSNTATASGISLGFLWDSRRNQINPNGGSYFNAVYRPKFTFLGSDANWQSLLIEFRQFVKLAPRSDNVLSFWSYNWLTLSGNPPYLLLPSTGWDANWNTGRGYTQGRYRGKDMVYLETEFRFGITPNGLLGGVLFANAQSFTEMTTNKFEYLAPACGLGLRIKLDKFSKTNFCVDYGWGLNGNRGFQFNIGEVF